MEKKRNPDGGKVKRFVPSHVSLTVKKINEVIDTFHRYRVK